MMEADPTDLMTGLQTFGQFVGMGGFSGLIAWLVVKMILRKTTEESVSSERAMAEMQIISQLRQEIDRLHANNVRLSEKIDQLQAEIAALRAENAELVIRSRGMEAAMSVVGRRSGDIMNATQQKQ